MARGLHFLLLILGFSLTEPPRIVLAAQAVPVSAETTPSALPPDVLFDRVAPSVFVVEGLGQDRGVLRQGSGVAIAHGVVTNRHVVAGATIVRVRQGTRTWVATVAGKSRGDR